jgi:hypothetical protein
VEAYPTSDGGVYVKAVFQTSAGNTYFTSITFANYPNAMPKVFVTKPALGYSTHRYPNDQICYLHPNMWNPGRHDLTFVLGRTAKWLNKYEVFRVTGKWPGAEVLH